jgi:hypothetical protein
MWILLVTSWVYGGAVLTTQEFGSKETCKAAILALTQLHEGGGPRIGRHAVCVPH